MEDAEKIKLLRDALEEIRELTCQPYVVKGQPKFGQRPATMQEKLDAWANIQSVAARTLRETDDGS